MAVTLAQAQLNAQDDIQAGVIDQLRRSSFLLDGIIFDDSVHPGGNGGTLTYGYQRVSTYGTATTRAFNAEYSAQEAQKARVTVDLKPFGGAFQIDRVLRHSRGLVDEVEFQVSQKVKATVAEWHDLFINGDNGSVATEFDGLDATLTGTDTEFGATTERDWTSISTEDAAFAELELIDEVMAALHFPVDAILGNTKSITRFKNLARRARYLTESEDAFGRKASMYDEAQLVDLGETPGSGDPVVPIETRDPDGDTTSTTGLSDLYFVHLGLEGVHGATLMDGEQTLMNVYLDEFMPDYRQSGAVRTGEVEMVAALAVRHTKSAAVLRNIKVQ